MKKPTMVMCICSPVSGDTEQGRLLEFYGQSVSLTFLGSSGLMVYSILNNRITHEKKKLKDVC